MVGAEIGVKSGDNAADILQNLDIARLYLIDSWEWKFGRLFKIVENRFRDDERIIILRNSSLEGSKKVTEPLDFAYIDAGHTYKDMKQDVETWSEKVKIGGFVCGHDYTERWPGIRKAILEYCSQRRIYYSVQADGKRMIDGAFYCNWWFRKTEHSSPLNRESYPVKII